MSLVAEPAVAYVHGSMAIDVDGSAAEIALAVVLVDGTAHALAAWSTEVGEYDRLILSRSPDGGRVAAAVGRTVRTFALRDGADVASSPIEHSEPQGVVFGWSPEGGPSTHAIGDLGAFGERLATIAHLEAFPIGGGWTIDVDGPIEDDGGFSGGYVSSSMGIGWSPGTPDDERSDDAAAARDRAIEASRHIAPTLRVRARRGDVSVEWSDDVAGGERGASLNWPPIVGPSGVLFRRTGALVEIRDPSSPFDIGAGSSEGPLAPWYVSNAGEEAVLAVELAVTPVCALPDGRFLLPGASETWRDGCDEPMHAVTPEGIVEPWLVAGRTIKPSQLVARVAPDLLPEELPDDPAHPVWPGDDGLWVTAARMAGDGTSVVLLLAEASWRIDVHEPDASDWLVVRVALDDGAAELLGRGHRPAGHHEVIAV